MAGCKERQITVIDAPKKFSLLSKEQAKGEEHTYCLPEPPQSSDCFRGSDRFVLVFICKGKISLRLLNHYI